ncbi:hypothetical protein JCM33374_g4123 [Metschnikowia sp. JCM 33374]|nr:hypothetical protein JCM33374_g4123 [Metschnikowia sp. JCM 33374]
MSSQAEEGPSSSQYDGEFALDEPDLEIPDDIDDSAEIASGSPLAPEVMRSVVQTQGSDLSPQMRQFIDKLEYAEIAIGTAHPWENTHHEVSKKGKLNEKEKRLFKYINTVLHYPPCVVLRSKNYKAKTEDTYKVHIIRYLLYIANKTELDETNFRIDGILIVECFKDVTKETQQMPGAIKFYKYALTLLQRCLGVFKAASIQDPYQKAKAIELWQEFPHNQQVLEYYKEYKTLMHQLFIKSNANKKRASLYQKKYTNDDIVRMFINMHIKRPASILLALSDLVYEEATTKNGRNIPIFGFQYTIGKTINAGSRFGLSGVSRHKDVTMCLVSALALSLWYRFDYDTQYGPLTGANALDFLDVDDWYTAKLLFAASKGSTGKNAPNSTEKHAAISTSHANTLATAFFDSIGFKSIKKTHAGRKNQAENADAFGVPLAQIRRAGRWDLDVLEERYTSCFAHAFIHFSAGFREDEQYYIARDIPVPEELQRMIFPWLEEVSEQVENRSKSEKARDGTVPDFLDLLQKFRSIVIQDLALLVDIVPQSIYCKHPITRTLLFQEFKKTMDLRMKNNSIFPPEVKEAADRFNPYFTRKASDIRIGVDQLNTKAEIHFATQQDEMRSLKASLPNLIEQGCKRHFYDLLEHEGNNHDKRHEELLRELKQVKQQNTQLQEIIDKKLDMILFGMSLNQNQSPSTASSHITDTAAPLVQSSEVHDAQRSGENQKNGRPEKKIKTEDPRFQGPEFSLLLKVASIPDLLKEWYDSEPGKPSIEERNRLFKAAWRSSDQKTSLHKRKKTFVAFIHDTLQPKLNLQRDEACMLLETYRKDHDWSMNTMRETLESKKSRNKLFNDIRERKINNFYNFHLTSVCAIADDFAEIKSVVNRNFIP